MQPAVPFHFLLLLASLKANTTKKQYADLWLFSERVMCSIERREKIKKENIPPRGKVTKMWIL
jgi:hypothetical protein